MDHPGLNVSSFMENSIGLKRFNVIYLSEGGAMYLVNCTAEQELCAMHDIKGFPIITTFRGLGWMGTSNCMSQKAQEKFKNYVRLDYHGVILVRDVYFLLGFFFRQHMT